jgi:hypothetical protein
VRLRLAKYLERNFVSEQPHLAFSFGAQAVATTTSRAIT